MNILIGESGLNVTRLVGEARSFVLEKLKGKRGTVGPNVQKKILSKPKFVMSKPAQVISITVTITKNADVDIISVSSTLMKMFYFLFSL